MDGPPAEASAVDHRDSSQLKDTHPFDDHNSSLSSVPAPSQDDGSAAAVDYVLNSEVRPN